MLSLRSYVGKRGTARLWKTPLSVPWGTVAYELRFPVVPLDERGNTTFLVEGLTETKLDRLNLVAETNPPSYVARRNGGPGNTQRLGLADCVVEIGLAKPGEDLRRISTARFKDGVSYVGPTGGVMVKQSVSLGRLGYEKDFTIWVRVVSPSRTSGDNLRITGVGRS